MKPWLTYGAVVAFLILIRSSLMGQHQIVTYTLNGTINADTGTVVLLPIGGSDYDPNSTNTYRAKIEHGHFTFKGQMAYPVSFLLGCFPTYVSSPFMVEPGQQTIFCNIDSLREIPKINNLSTREVRFVLYQAKAVLLAYIHQHPNSYAAMWELVHRMGNGYEPALDSIYNALSPTLKNTFTGKRMAQQLQSSKVTAIGQLFPVLHVADVENQPTLIPKSIHSKYTLVDFWFSHCGPCLSEFPKLNELYEAYHPKGFSILGISTDKEADVEHWKQVIKDKKLPWYQYLDVAGKITVNDLSIRMFPSNFLLDEHGVIIKKNISPGELGKFLAEKL